MVRGVATDEPISEHLAPRLDLAPLAAVAGIELPDAVGRESLRPVEDLEHVPVARDDPGALAFAPVHWSGIPQLTVQGEGILHIGGSLEVQNGIVARTVPHPLPTCGVPLPWPALCLECTLLGAEGSAG